MLSCAKKTALMMAVLVLAAGCGKKKEASAPVVPVETSAETPTVVPASTPQANSTVEVNQSLADADAAIKAKAYDKAVQALLAVQNQKQLSEQQAAEARNRMIGLQASLAQAVANGDPNAKAAADMLRAAHMAH